MTQNSNMTEEREVHIDLDSVTLEGSLSVPREAEGIVVFAHGSGSSRFSPRNRQVAAGLARDGLATLLMDLLTPKEDEIDMRTRELRFNIDLLAERVVGATDWLGRQASTRDLAIGYFGASTGAAAALKAAAERPDSVHAIVSRGGRPDLALPVLPRVQAPTLLIVGELDQAVIAMNREAADALEAENELAIVSGATHLFEEPGALEEVARLASRWFQQHLGAPQRSGR